MKAVAVELLDPPGGLVAKMVSTTMSRLPERCRASTATGTRVWRELS